jgi:Immunity protein 40
MMKNFVQYSKANGVPVDAGTNTEFAFSRVNAMTSLNLFREQEVGILGGDVFVLVDGRLVHVYANWHCDPRVNESKQEFAIRSQSTARNYIENYPSKDLEPFFSFVLR